MVATERETEFKRILVPLDGSPLAEHALGPAQAIAARFGSEIVLLRVLDIPTPTAPADHPESTMGWVREARRAALEEAEQYLETLEHRLSDQDYRVRAIIRDSSPAQDILDAGAAEQVDLIVMSTHGQGGLLRWTFGSVAEKVARHASCPVLLVRPASSADSER